MTLTPVRRYHRGHSLVTMDDVPAGQSRVYHFDHQGTTQCLTDSTGAVTDRFSADAWGVEVKRTGTSINRQWYIGNTGYYSHTDWTAVYVRARYVQPTFGRWLSVDPLLLAKTSNGGPVGAYKYWETNSSLWAVASVVVLTKYSYVDLTPAAQIDPAGKYPTGNFPIGTLPYTCSTSPDGPCGYAKAKGDDKGHLGGVVCCCGKSYLCDWTPPGTPPFIKKCTLVHEKYHSDTAPCVCFFGLRTYCRLSFSDDQTQNSGECEAYKKELECLKDELDKCPPRDRMCRVPVFIRMQATCYDMEDYCKKAGISLPKWCSNNT